LFFISVLFFFLRFSISWGTSSFVLSIFTLNSFISLFMVCSVSVWCLFTLLWFHLFVSVFSHILEFCFLGISWVSCFGWPCLVTSLWNSHWFPVWFLLSGCSCGLRCVPWYGLSLFHWSLDLGIHFLHFTLNPVLLYFCGENGLHPFFV
jgi:hypothetical protein